MHQVNEMFRERARSGGPGTPLDISNFAYHEGLRVNADERLPNG